MNKGNRIIKILGNILTGISLFFVFQRLWKSGVDLSSLIQKDMLLVFIFLTGIQVLKIFIACFPWLQAVEVLSSEVIPFTLAQKVYVKSNLFKYIPGNVFQYIGRNELAIQKGISHIDVGFATLIDVGLMFLASLCTAIILMKDYAVQSIASYSDNIIKIIIIGGLIFLVIFFLFFPKYKDLILKYFHRYIGSITLKNIIKIGYCIIYYALYNVVACFMFVLMMYVLSSGTLGFDIYLKLAGAYTLSFVIGFITPGASGGLGIREAAMMILAGGLVREDMIVMASLFMRIVGIFGDIIAYFLLQFGTALKEKSQSRHTWKD